MIFYFFIATVKDATVALAEKIAGTESAFVKLMNDKVRELGLKNTNFVNSTGLDAENHYSTAYDMSVMARELIKHEKILEFSSIYEDYLRKNTDNSFWLVNTNKLVRYYSYIDGLKTGYTESAGYCLTATMKKDNMRVIATVMGEPESTTRNTEVSSMLDYAFAQYKIDRVLKKGSVVKKVNVNKAKVDKIKLVPTEDVTILSKKIEKSVDYDYEIEVEDIKLPIKVGDIMGKMYLKDGNKIIREIELTVNKNVEKANIIELFGKYISDILSGNMSL